MQTGDSFLTFRIQGKDADQNSAKRGTASKFEAKVNLKVLVPNSKPSSILKNEIRAHTNAEA